MLEGAVDVAVGKPVMEGRVTGLGSVSVASGTSSRQPQNLPGVWQVVVGVALGSEVVVSVVV